MTAVPFVAYEFGHYTKVALQPVSGGLQLKTVFMVQL